MKNVAAFSNSFGGTLIVGAVEVKERLSKYLGLSDTEKQRTLIQDFCEARLSPRQSIHPFPLKTGSGEDLVIVNVEPSTTLVAFKTFDDAWRFPVRKGARTYFLTFEEAEKKMSEPRRKALLIQDIPFGETPPKYRVTLDVHQYAVVDGLHRMLEIKKHEEWAILEKN